MKISLDGDSTTTPAIPHWKYAVSFLSLVVMIAVTACHGDARAQQPPKGATLVQPLTDGVTTQDILPQQPIVQHEADSVPAEAFQILHNPDGSITVPDEMMLTYEPKDDRLWADLIQSQGEWSFQVTISQYADPVVIIRQDGSVELNPDVSLDEASKLFWLALANNLPCKVSAEVVR